MNPGRLNRLITIATPTYGTSAYGANAEPSWTTIASVWAMVQESSGTESVQADQRVSRSSTTFTINFRSDVTVKQRITYNGRHYNIEGMREIGYRAYLEINAEAIV